MTLAHSFVTLLQYVSLRDPHILLVSFLSWVPRAMHCDEQLWHMHQTTACDPKPKYTNDCYQVVQSNDVIKTKATLSSRLNDPSAIGYLLNTACPLASTPCNGNTDFVKSIPHTVMCVLQLSIWGCNWLPGQMR